MKKLKRYGALLALFALCVCLSGCQLAREELKETAPDRLIGVFVTRKHLETDESGRLYATAEDETYSFPGAAGVCYIAARQTDPATGDVRLVTGSDNAVSDAHSGIHTSDDAEGITLEGTLFVVPSPEDVFYMNAVYQSADERVYAVRGNGFMAGDIQNNGIAYTHTLKENSTITENGQSKTYSLSVSLSISFMPAPEEITLLQMDAEHRVLESDAYAPGSVPEKLSALPDAAYILVETRGRKRSGAEAISRALYAPGDQLLETFARREDDVCVKQYCELSWN